MKISQQTQNFLDLQVDKNKNGTSYGELQQTLDQNKDGKIDASVEAHITPEDKAIIEKALKEAAEGEHEPSEIAFPAPSKTSSATSQPNQINPIRQIGSLTVPQLPWPVPTGIKIPGAMLQENFGLGITSPDMAIENAKSEVKKFFSVPNTAVSYDPNLKDAGKFDPLTGKIHLGNDAFRSPAYLQATLTHELVHRRNFIDGHLFKHPLGQSEVMAYNFVLGNQDQLGLSVNEVTLIRKLKNQVKADWKTGKEPGYAHPVRKPPAFEQIIEFLQGK